MQDAAPRPQDNTTPPGPEAEGSGFEELIAAEELRGRAEQTVAWIRDAVLTPDAAIQFAILILCLAAGAIAARPLKKLIDKAIAPRAEAGAARRFVRALSIMTGPIAIYLFLQAGVIAMAAAERPRAWLEAFVSLITAWIVIRLVTLVIRSPLWSRAAFVIAWPIAALDILGFLKPLIDQLEAAAISFGPDGPSLSALDAVRGFIAFGILMWLAAATGQFLERRIYKIEELTPSLQTLIVQILKIFLPILAFLIALNLIGVNLAALAVFGGALGLGVGLGLQRTVSNLTSGFTMIMDKSIKPGDVISVEDTFGWVTSLGARYVSIRTRDGTEHLVPNDMFVENGVVNWSHNDKTVRLKVQIGVAYDADVHRAIALCEEAARETERILDAPKPQCHLIGFGDSAIDLELRFWIRDPENGVTNVKSGVFLKIWDKFKAEGVEIPFPQRDLHIKSMARDGDVDASIIPLER
ncbi:MAG: mechanosensitive ion channel domain-containing protein [Pseudomonadota bacterium]